MFDLYLTIGDKGVCVEEPRASAVFRKRPKLRNEGGSFDKRRVCAYGRRSTLLERFGVEVLWTLRFVYVFQSWKKGKATSGQKTFATYYRMHRGWSLEYQVSADTNDYNWINEHYLQTQGNR